MKSIEQDPESEMAWPSQVLVLTMARPLLQIESGFSVLHILNQDAWLSMVDHVL